MNTIARRAAAAAATLTVLAPILAAGTAYAHTTEAPHAHPHLMELSGLDQAALVAGLLALAVVMLTAARRALVRRRK
jgi:pheromone shutdown protein TraB